MIYLFNDSKFKEQKYKTSDDLFKGLNNTDIYTKHKDEVSNWEGFNSNSIEDLEKFDKKIKRGDNVYCWVEPYVPGYSDGDCIFWFDNPTEAEDSYYQWVDNI